MIGVWPSDPRSLIRRPGRDGWTVKCEVMADLANASDEDLLAAHRYVLLQACTITGPSIYIVHRVLAKLALEILDRGLDTFHLTHGVRAHFHAAWFPWLN